jgi:hypothetical protein
MHLPVQQQWPRLRLRVQKGTPVRLLAPCSVLLAAMPTASLQPEADEAESLPKDTNKIATV